MSVFEPKAVVSILRNSSIVQPGEREKFKLQWTQSVKTRVEKWKNLPVTKACNHTLIQLEWEAEVVEYVNLLWNTTRCRSSKATAAKTLGYDVPILGPRFVPPTYLHSRLRPGSVSIKPDTQYIRPINIVHPLYYLELARCPQCQSCDNVTWEGWTTTGARELHGISHEETALGLQLRCDACKRGRMFNHPEFSQEHPSSSGVMVVEDNEAERSELATGRETRGTTKDGGSPSYCFALTSHVFWKRWNHWEIPCEIPIFYKRCALTRQLFNLVIELRPSTTSAGLAEQFKQLHLLEYHRRKLEYLKAVRGERTKAAGTVGLAKFGITTNTFKAFSTPDDTQAYADKSISHEMITEVFLDFSGRTRQAESELYLRSLPTRCGSMDSTFKSASKATITDSHCRRSKELRGGILSMLNEKGEIVAWWLCQTKANAEMTEILTGVRRRHEVLGLPMPEMMVTDNCCQVRHAVQSALPETDCILDVWHFIARYIAVILNSQRNMYRAAVAADITNTILRKHSVKGAGAEYWSKEEQEQKLEAAFAKWAEKGTVWSAAAMQVHREQLKHVQKGCLERRRQDIPSDGSRIEGSHKGWNSLQRTQPSGITVLVALGHDFVLRCNVHVGFSGIAHNSTQQAPFLTLTHGSHHVSLIAAIAALHNQILKVNVVSSIDSLPELSDIHSNEVFGLTVSDHASTFGGMIEVKEEPMELDNLEAMTTSSLTFEHDAAANLTLQATRPILEELHINLSLLDQPWKAEACKSAELPLEPETALSSQPIKSITAAKRKLDSLVADEAPGSHSSPASEPVESPIEVPLVTKRVRLGSESDSLTTHSKIALAPAHVISDLSPQAPASKLDHYFKATARIPSTITPSNTLKPMSSQGGLAQPSDASTMATVTATSSTTVCVPRALTTTGPEASSTLPRFCVEGLTRSQRLFSLTTNIDPRSLLVQGDNKFYLFMDMRAEFKWVSHEMTPKQWVNATAEYNKRLVAKRLGSGPSVVLKHPLALLRKLGELEPKLIGRIMKGDYKSKWNTGTEAFWKRHCEAIDLVKPEAEATSRKPRKAQMCSRCQTIMYPGPEGSSLNHKRGYCGDGVRQVSKVDEVPPWPQPRGVFTAGKTFHPQAFYLTLQDIYERHCMPSAEPTPIATMEVVAFVQLLASRVCTFDDGMIGFRLLPDYELDPRTPSGYIFHPNDHSGEWLRLAYLQRPC